MITAEEMEKEKAANAAFVKESNEKTDATDSPETLARAWVVAKNMEDSFAAVRSHIGKKLAVLLPVPEGQQSKTHTCGDFKVGVKPTTNYKVNWKELDAAYDAVAVPEGQVKIAKPEGEPKRQLDEKGLRWIRDNAKDLYLAISQAITATPGTTGITVEHKPKEQE